MELLEFERVNNTIFTQNQKMGNEPYPQCSWLFFCLTSRGMGAASLYARDLQESSLETVKMDVIWLSSSMSVRMDQNSAWMLLDSFVGIYFCLSFALENHQMSNYSWRKCLKYSTMTWAYLVPANGEFTTKVYIFWHGFCTVSKPLWSKELLLLKLLILTFAPRLVPVLGVMVPCCHC